MTLCWRPFKFSCHSKNANVRLNPKHGGVRLRQFTVWMHKRSTKSYTHTHTHARAHARKELGHWSDPMGTESRKRAIKQDYWSKVGVLGLAPCHVSEKEIIGLQVRPAGQAGYPISPVASLDTVPVKCCVPPLYEKRKTAEVLHLFRRYTHTHAWQTVCRLWVTSCFPSRDLDIPI